MFGLNVAKKNDCKKILIVEGYMDTISLYQRGITNVVASLGTALTEAQGRLLRRSCEQVILGYDADGAGQAAIIRGMDILQDLGCDIRVLQIQGAKDPDEFVVKYGPDKFKYYMDRAISLVEFKVKVLKKELDIENVNDKIKFLNQIAKLLSKINNSVEREIYIDKISETYKISKEAIYAEVNKLTYADNQGQKVLEKTKPVVVHKKTSDNNKVSEAVKKRENAILSILLRGDISIFQIIKQQITPNDFKFELNQGIAKKVYEEFEKGNSNINAIIDKLTDEEQSHITMIMADDDEITDMEKAIDEIMQAYEKEKLNDRKFEILTLLDTRSG